MIGLAGLSLQLPSVFTDFLCAFRRSARDNLARVPIISECRKSKRAIRKRTGQFDLLQSDRPCGRRGLCAHCRQNVGRSIFFPNHVMISRIWLAFPVLILCVFGLGPPREVHDKPTPGSLISGAESPSSFRTEFLQELAFCEHRFVLIAEPMPADRYSWRPAQGMRSLGGLFAHVAIANYEPNRGPG